MESQMNCKVCNLAISKSNIKDKEVISCDSCRAYFHFSSVKEKNCSNISSTEQRALILQSRSIIFFCDDCRDAFKSIPLLVRQIDSLKNDVESLKLEVADLKKANKVISESFSEGKSTNSITNVLNNANDVISEITERESRKKNVIIFGLPEAEDIQNDKAKCLEILKTVDSQVESIPKLFRLGKIPTNGTARPRPIKILLTSSDKAIELMKKAKILKSIDRFKNITLTSDKTPIQQQQYKELKLELNRRMSNGEKNLIIKYRNGEPKIVKN